MLLSGNIISYSMCERNYLYITAHIKGSGVYFTVLVLTRPNSCVHMHDAEIGNTP